MIRTARIEHSQKKKSRGCLARCSAQAILLLALLVAAGAAMAGEDGPRVVPSADGTPISYRTFGSGEPALVFVHGWSCDSGYWREQVPYFSGKRKVIVLDLAGHGRSGAGRKAYTMKSFGQDVKAVVEAAGSRKVILIGHSMGGAVIAEAARLMPDRVVGLIGVDTLDNIEYPLTRPELDGMLVNMRKDFRAGTREFVSHLFLPGSDPAVREWVITDMSSAPPEVALSVIEEYLGQYLTGEAAQVFDGLRIPVVDVNGALAPIDYEANRRHMFSFQAIVLKDADHFLMLDKPGEFNTALEKAVGMILESKGE